MTLDHRFKADMRKRIEDSTFPAMEAIYRPGRVTFDEEFRPGLKIIEKAVSFHDYAACGISVLAVPAARGDARAAELLERVLATMDHYRTRIWNHEVGDRRLWTVPLRRLIFHVAMAYQALESRLSAREQARYRELVDQQVPAAIEHCREFLPGVRDLHLGGVNNHTAIFMQGIWHCGRVFGRPEWIALAREFAERYLASGHPDGYFEEHTNAAREGGPSMIYTPLTAGCLFDVLEGSALRQERFLRAGDFFRSFVDAEYRMMSIADERANPEGRPLSYGMALHSLSPRGRGFIVGLLRGAELSTFSPEGLAVLYHELDLMVEGDCETPENLREGASRIDLPLGVLRRNGFTAGISALRALNRDVAASSDYALDRQTMVSLSHASSGGILLGIKSKNDPSYSTFCVGDDAYTVATGTLDMGVDWAEATLRYKTFAATIRWEIRERARLTLRVDTDAAVTTALPIRNPPRLVTKAPFELRMLRGFSPYTAGNAADPVRAAIFEWRKELSLELAP